MASETLSSIITSRYCIRADETTRSQLKPLDFAEVCYHRPRRGEERICHLQRLLRHIPVLFALQISLTAALFSNRPRDSRMGVNQLLAKKHLRKRVVSLIILFQETHQCMAALRDDIGHFGF